MKNRHQLVTTCLMVAGLLTVATVLSVEQKALAAEPPADPAHAAHVASGAMPADATKGDPALSQQIVQLQAKVAQLEAALAKNAPSPAVAASPAAGAMPGMPAPAAPMAGMKSAAPGATTAASGMGGMTAPPGGAMNKMAMMEKMMGMMDKMMSMDDGAMPAAPMAGGGGMGMGMGMGMMSSEKGGMGGGAMLAGAPAAGMPGGGGMGMDKMEMAGMMGMGAMSNGVPAVMAQSALPGFPGASHLYHIGATDFFLDHPQHITLTTEQQVALNKAKEQAILAKSAADRAVAQAEQDLWTLTASDQPDAAKIEAKVREVEKLRGDQRLDFIQAVGEAAKLLTDEQRQSLLGLKPTQPQSKPAKPAAPAGGMKGM